MRIEVVDDSAALAERAANRLLDIVRARPDARLGLPTGATPIDTYRLISERAGAAFAPSRAWAVDEFCASARDAPGTNAAFFAEHLRLEIGELRVPNAAAPDPAGEIAAFAGDIRSAGGFDLCLLGIGVNGHIAFNEPPAARGSRARVVQLSPASRRAHAESFGSPDAVPSHGMTLGVADLLDAREILLLAHGAAKAEIVRRAVEGPAGEDVPASWLQTHDHVTWLLDRAAAAKLSVRA
jgi:glucosamine-6-phosphate deaminase